MNKIKISWLAFPLFLCVAQVSAAQEADSSAADQRKVTVLMRLKDIDVNEKPKLKIVVVRYLQTVTDESEYLTYAERFQLAETVERLWMIARISKNESNRVKAFEILIDQSDLKTVTSQLKSAKEPIPLIRALGLVASKQAIEILKPLVIDKELSVQARNMAVKGLGRQKPGQQFLLELVNANALPADCEFTTANILLSSDDPAIKNAAAKTMQLPTASGSRALSPIADLLKRTGEIENGIQIFAKSGTCANCHKVAGQGKEVGPDLSEIGGKLSRQAMYESILNPSLAVSHNFETYLVETVDGLSFSGILISETDEKVVLRTAEAVTKELLKEDLEGMKKSKKSLMPNDLQKNFSEGDLVDLVEYLMTLRKK